MRIYVEIMTSIQREYFDVDSTFKIDDLSMSSPRGFFHVVSTSNRRNFCTPCFRLNYSGIMLSRCNFNVIDVITDFGTIGNISFGNIETMQINRNNDKFYVLQNNTNRDHNANITKNNTYLLQNNTNQSFQCKCLYVQTILYLLQNNTKQKVFGF